MKFFATAVSASLHGLISESGSISFLLFNSNVLVFSGRMYVIEFKYLVGFQIFRHN